MSYSRRALERRRERKVISSPLAAVAYQDHIARELGLVESGVTSKQQTGINHSNLTLAQRMGLVACPPQPLTSIQWRHISETSNRRGDSAQPCPICQDDFRQQDQILLSCSHTFHKSCLNAFERYSGKRRCPLCRCSSYETKQITTAANIYKHKAATKIQSVWKGYKIRKWYNLYRLTHPPIDPVLKLKHYTNRFSMINDQLVDTCNSTCTSVDVLLAAVDSDLNESRKVMSFDEADFSSPDWETISKKANQYLITDCAICLAPLSLPRPLTLLSCSHLYHTPCLSALESFTDDFALHLCPICRKPYISKSFKLQK